ncbi:hypothetical protein EPN16_07480, partial [bacterium]
VLIVYATAGAGHKKAAQALESYLQNTRPELSSKAIDILDYTPKFFRALYSEGYTFLISRLPWLWFILYRVSYLLSNNPIFACIDYITSQPFIRLLKREKYDIVISTHFLVNSAISVYKNKNPEINLRLISIITDYNLHPIWISEAVSAYITSCGYVKDELIKRGVDEAKIKDFGIPAHPKFYASLDRGAIALKLGVDQSRFTALIMTGAFGIGPIEKIVESLAGKMQLLVVCGRNRGLYSRLSSANLKGVKVYPLVENVEELMSVSDAILTKAGGLSITESLIKGLPMIFFSNIPGLETANARVISGCGAGFIADAISDIKRAILSLESDRSLYEKTRLNINKIKHIDTLDRLSEFLLALS